MIPTVKLKSTVKATYLLALNCVHIQCFGEVVDKAEEKRGKINRG